MSSFISYFNDQMPDILNRLIVSKEELDKIQNDLERLLIMAQDPEGYFTNDNNGDNMELFILVIGDKIKQVSTLNEAACLKFLAKEECRLFKLDMVKVVVEELKIPVLGFGNAV